MLLFLLAVAPIAGAQQIPMAALAARLADAIAQSGQKSVVVFDFSGPGSEVTALGEKLADDLRIALAKSGENIQIKERSQLEAIYYEPGDVLDPESTLMFARQLKAKAFVVGQISLGKDDKTASAIVEAYRCDNGKGIGALKVTFPVTEEVLSSVATVVSAVDLSGYPDSVQYGYSPPKCGYCPGPGYPETAAGIRGNVDLLVIVGANGRVTHISVVKGLSGGLTMQAIKTVRAWKMKPATGPPDGRPTAVRYNIEVHF